MYMHIQRKHQNLNGFPSRNLKGLKIAGEGTEYTKTTREGVARWGCCILNIRSYFGKLVIKMIYMLF